MYFKSKDDISTLRKAVQKAVKNSGGGFKFCDHENSAIVTGISIHPDEDVYLELDNEIMEYTEIEQIIFNKEFAKAFWGKEKRDGIIGVPLKVVENRIKKKHPNKIYNYSVKPNYVEEWIYQLQQLVVSENPINDLKEFI